MIHSLSPATISNTYGQPGKDGLDFPTYTRWLLEIQNQPTWRSKADRQMDYVDGNQLDAEILQKQALLGIPPAIENLIGPAVDSVLGLEAKTRTDWKISADNKGGDDVADALNYRLNQAERNSGADEACGDAFKPQLCVGIGWVEVARESDPFKFPYRCTAIHRNEIWWDMLDKEPGLPKARYLVRRRWTDVEQIKLKFPDKKDLIDRCSGRWSENYELSLDGGQTTDLYDGWNQERGWSIEEQEWRDSEAKRLCLFEVWYRRWEEVMVLRLPDGRVVEYDKSSAMHVIAVASGSVKPQKTVVSRMYVSFWAGPHKLYDGKTPYRHNDFPYVKFTGKTEDRTGTPYGVVKSMMYLQDSVNSAISKIRWGLSSTRTTRTKGAVAYSDEIFRQQASRVDADIVLDANHMSQPGAVFKIERDFQLTEQQYQMLQDSKGGIERASGISASFQGQKGTARSGIQETTQLEQATQSLAKLMSNFKAGRTKVGELLLSLIIEDMLDKQETVTIRGNALRPDREVMVNVPQVDPETGVKYLDNDVSRIRLQVALSDVPSTPSFRTQQLASMSEAFKAMPQEFQVVALPHLLSLMDIPDKDQIIEDIQQARQKTTPEQLQAKIDEAVAAALQKAGFELKNKELDLKYAPERMMAEIKKLVAETVEIGVKSSYSAMQAAQVIASIPQVAPIADVVMQGAGYQAPNPGGMDPNFPQPEAMPMPEQGLPEVQQNTSPQLPPVPQSPGAGAMDGIETARADGLSM